jgi:hypothetical protein
MFHVLVIGGIALVACGGAEVARPIPDVATADGSGDEAFPSETDAAVVDASVSVDAAPDSADASLTIAPTDSADAAVSDEPYIFPIESPR